MRIVVAGGSGFVGDALVPHLASRGQVFVLTRNADRVSFGTPLEWHPPSSGAWEDTVASADVIINLAGASLADGRWTARRREELLRSRLDPTRALVRAMKRRPDYERTFISVSGIDIYRDAGDAVVDESAPHNPEFIGSLVEKWEAAAGEAERVARVAIPRFAMILHPDGGALKKMLPAFRFGAGGQFGNGRHWVPWITRDDAVRVIAWLIDTPDASGAYNATAPHPVTNRAFTRALGSVLRRPTFMRVPRWALRVGFGPMVDEVLLVSHRAVPARLIESGFEFRHEELRNALGEMLG